MKKLFLMLIFFLSVTAHAGDKMRVSYTQLPTLSIETPADWVVYEKRIFGVEPKNREIDVAGTVYRAGEKTLSEFTKDKHESTLAKMSWYKPVEEAKELKGLFYPAFIAEYEGVWPNESEPTRYVVTTFKVDGYFLSLTFTGLRKKLNNYRSIIKDIYSSVKLENS